jgi:hypothetical protein
LHGKFWIVYPPEFTLEFLVGAQGFEPWTR